MSPRIHTLPEQARSALARVRRWPSAEARAWVEDLVAMLCDDERVSAVVIYGSSVRDAAGSSDIDLLFVHEGAPPELALPPLDVDARGYERSTVEAEVARGHEVLGWALRYGVLVWERDGFWSSLAARWRGAAPLPSADAAEERAARALRTSEDLRSAGDDDAAREQLLVALTQRARARLIRAGVYPRSRPELPLQLRTIGEGALAAELSRLIESRAAA